LGNFDAFIASRFDGSIIAVACSLGRRARLGLSVRCPKMVQAALSMKKDFYQARELEVGQFDFTNKTLQFRTRSSNLWLFLEEDHKLQWLENSELGVGTWDISSNQLCVTKEGEQVCGDVYVAQAYETAFLLENKSTGAVALQNVTITEGKPTEITQAELAIDRDDALKAKGIDPSVLQQLQNTYLYFIIGDLCSRYYLYFSTDDVDTLKALALGLEAKIPDRTTIDATWSAAQASLGWTETSFRGVAGTARGQKICESSRLSSTSVFVTDQAPSAKPF
jgi:hypothetical protein